MYQELWQLRQKQSLPLGIKIIMSQRRITQWCEQNDGDVYVSFSGGKDSTVLLHLVRELYPEVEAVFVNTGLEYPEILRFVKSVKNVTILYPKLTFNQVIQKYGFPVISKKIARGIWYLQNPTKKNAQSRKLYLTGFTASGNYSEQYKIPDKWLYLRNAPFKISDKCCKVMKKNPIGKYNRKTGKKAFIGLMASDSKQREKNILSTGCNNFKQGTSNPLSFWTERDIWQYIRLKKLRYCNIYDRGINRTGCIFCMFGVHLDKYPNRFHLLKRSHPKLFNYCIKKLGLGKVLDYLRIDYGQQKYLTEMI